MTQILYYLFIIPVSLLPYPVLYGLSNCLYYIFYYVVGYRKAVVVRNIENSFPGKTQAERVQIIKEFYRHFCDLMLESLKVFTISRKDVVERMTFNFAEVANQYYDQGRSIIIAGGHSNNWELFAVGVAAAMKHKAVAFYKPLTNVFFDEKMRETRSKYGLNMVPTNRAKEVFEENKNTLTATIFGIDQSPAFADKCYWTTFLNQDTGVQFGVEKFAKEYDLPVVYGVIRKLKRGYYCFDFINVTDQPGSTAYGEISEKVTRMLEKDILEEPAHWLWSHKRWKHQRPNQAPASESA